MKRFVPVGVVVMVVLPMLVPSPAAADAALDSLVASERAFAALSSAKGMKEAFLTYLTEDAVVFQPTATNGRKAWEGRPESKSTLLWEPSFAQVSSAGDLGYTTGPWEHRTPADSAGTPERLAYGHFNSVWRKQRHGGWRVVADIGVAHGKPDRGGVGSGEFTPGPTMPIRTMKPPRLHLGEQDQKLSKTMRTVGPRDALAAHGALDMRLSVEGKLPAIGIEAAQALIDFEGYLVFHEQGSGVASSGDLGYTYGWAERFVGSNTAPADSSVNLHVWRQDKGRTWLLALAVLNPLQSH